MDLPTAPLNVQPNPVRPRPSRIAWFILFFLIADLVILAVILNWLISHSQDSFAFNLPAPTAAPSPSVYAALPNVPTVTPAPTETPTPPPTATPVPTATPIPPTVTPEPPTPTPGPTQLLVNPDFGLNWSFGWKQAVGYDYGGQTDISVVQHPSVSTNAVALDHTGQTFTSIYQVVKVQNLLARFSAQLAGYTSTNGLFGDKSGLAGMALNFYYDDPNGLNPTQPDGTLLYVTGSKYQSGRAFGLYPLANSARPGTVVARSFEPRGQTLIIANLQGEVQKSLPSLNTSRIKAIGVVLFVGGSDGCNDDECTARLYAGSFQLKTLVI